MLKPSPATRQAPAGGHTLVWPPGMQRTPRRQRWFDRLSKLKPGLDIGTVARKLKRPYATVWLWVQTFEYRFVDNRGRPPKVHKTLSAKAKNVAK